MFKNVKPKEYNRNLLFKFFFLCFFIKTDTITVIIAVTTSTITVATTTANTSTTITTIINYPLLLFLLQCSDKVQLDDELENPTDRVCSQLVTIDNVV